MDLSWIDSLKSSLFPINRHLLKLKVCYFMVYSVWFSVFPYASLISTQIIDYTQLTIIYACLPFTSILGSIFTGFLADKIGNYNIILTFVLLLNLAGYLPVLWLESDHRSYLTSLNQTNCSVDDNVTSADCYVPQKQNSYIFPILLVARLISFYSFDASNFLLDTCCLKITQQHGGDFARQKMFSMISMAIVPFTVGALMDAISEYRGFKDYSIAFYMSTGFTLIVCVMTYQLDVKVERNKQSFVKTAKEIVKMIDVDAFLLVEVVVGVCLGWHRSFFPVYVDVELQASKTLFGAATSISGIGSMFMFWMSKSIIKKFGAPMTMALSLLISGLRFVVYYFLNTPWISLIIELLEGTGGFLALTAGNYFCGSAAPAGMLASLNGLLAAAVFGAGRGSGLTAGSILISIYGLRATYFACGVLAGLAGLTYILSYHLFFKKIERARLSLMASENQKPTELTGQKEVVENAENTTSADDKTKKSESLPN